ncbi:siroheme decarboxylase subunit beta [Crenobacter caeni]|uniref:siroheme decarboxylase n=1 Tax=Crenobacter caeni TaxID=2705474 RepID=A0A6B2KV61_9NEIS|nr:Lrp/AsnC family transcriptional regulator [Crenobacter caeni]NDV14041.1 Lrp/AsnC family transcriptional regulator [Crenobacter caeni]
MAELLMRLLPLIDASQHRLPLCPRPFAELAARFGLVEDEVIAGLAQLQRRGTVSRIGAVCAPGAVGASTLAALSVPPARMAEVASMVSAQAEVNHNYARAHRYNLWFVLTAADRAGVEVALARIGRDSGLAVLDLPLTREYHIDLGFSLTQTAPARARAVRPAAAFLQDAAERALLRRLARGLPLQAAPYAAVAAELGCSEAWVLDTLARHLDSGAVRRFGVIVRHHELGWRHNAMCVWHIADEAQRDAAGAALAREPHVNLCYARRAAVGWPYTLYAMLHGQDALAMRDLAAALSRRHGLSALPRAVLLSTCRFKQRGARYDARAG